VHHVASFVRLALEKKEFCPFLFLDVSQVFDRVWIQGLFHKVSSYLSAQRVKLLESYLYDRLFRVHSGDAKASVRPIAAGVPQGSMLGPHLYLMYTADFPTNDLAAVACCTTT